jgi:hypothetical protein
MSWPPTCWFNFSQQAAVGHDGSDGRTRRTELTEAARIGFERYRSKTESNRIAASGSRKPLLFVAGDRLKTIRRFVWERPRIYNDRRFFLKQNPIRKLPVRFASSGRNLTRGIL